MNKFIFLTFNRTEGVYSSKKVIDSSSELSMDLMKEVLKKEFDLTDEEVEETQEWNKIEMSSDMMCQDCDEHSYLLTQI